MMNMDLCHSVLHQKKTFFCKNIHLTQVSLLFLKLAFKSKRQTQHRQTIVFDSLRAWAKTWGWHKTHCAEERAVQAAICHAEGREMNQTAQRWVMRNSPSRSMQISAVSQAVTLSWHWHRAAVTPLPGVSAPAGLRLSPLGPLFAAAQPSLCPVSAGKAGQYSLRQVIIGKMD